MSASKAEMLRLLREAGEEGADLSPGDPLARWAFDEIVSLVEERAKLEREVNRLRVQAQRIRDVLGP